MIENEYKDFVPGETIVGVFEISADGQGKVYKKRLWEGYLSSITTRGLMLVPLGENGVSVDPLAATFVAFPEYRTDGVYSYEKVSKRN